MSTTTTTPKNGQADAPPAGAMIDGLLVEVIDLERYATTVLDLAYNAHAILQYGIDEKSPGHTDAALVMLDFLCQEHLSGLLGTIEEMARTARARRRTSAKGAAASGDGAIDEAHLASEPGA